MLTRIATAALAISLLGASAFALPPLAPVKTSVSGVEQSGGTVIEKNSAWPLKEQMSMDPCMVKLCLEA